MTLNTVIPSSRQSLHGSITTGADILKRFVTGQGMYSASRGMSGMGDGLTTPGGAVELRISTPMMCLLRRPSRSRCAVSLPIAAAQWQRPTPKGIGKGNPASLHWTLLIDSVVPMNACFKGHFWWSWPMAHKDLSPDGTRENSRNQRSGLSNATIALQCMLLGAVIIHKLQQFPLFQRSMNDTTHLNTHQRRNSLHRRCAAVSVPCPAYILNYGLHTESEPVAPRASCCGPAPACLTPCRAQLLHSSTDHLHTQTIREAVGGEKEVREGEVDGANEAVC